MITQTRRLPFKTDDGLSVYEVEAREEGKMLAACWLGAIRPWRTLGYVIGRRGNWLAYYEMPSMKPSRNPSMYPIEWTVAQAAEHIIEQVKERAA